MGGALPRRDAPPRAARRPFPARPRRRELLAAGARRIRPGRRLGAAVRTGTGRRPVARRARPLVAAAAAGALRGADARADPYGTRGTGPVRVGRRQADTIPTGRAGARVGVLGRPLHRPPRAGAAARLVRPGGGDRGAAARTGGRRADASGCRTRQAGAPRRPAGLRRGAGRAGRRARAVPVERDDGPVLRRVPEPRRGFPGAADPRRHRARRRPARPAAPARRPVRTDAGRAVAGAHGTAARLHDEPARGGNGGLAGRAGS